ncbi:DUF1593 domain-containing protein [Cereibacter sphaeroides]|uniref:nucleoside hydrolase-like domain-containing protein n=1 Tax=Cereibacter sphaeroides TaxID=1063 RepID=UPI001F30924C|nr:nucleoside hydrolase-like domain-containing protein [Cereibacter sphaeroides]MCE6957552.1 DUF1593 domain-containing protein [Cereibacter sphaeroides]MCE6967036.1 DUF1593 domain-containing protein [Cereibacter sphaeroides]MCE6971118.1 DUF1593 domain-containing protein [Cereibacter sphaeroides]
MPLPRVFISTDLRLAAEEKDDSQSLIHALLYQDKMNIVGIAATPSKWNAQDGLVGDIDRIIDTYGLDHAKLAARSGDFKTVEQLKAVSWQGALDTAPGQGWSSPTDSSRAIIAETKKAAAAGEVLNVLTWGGETDLAQALHDDPSIAPHIRFFSIDDQDEAAYAYIKANFKGAFDMWVDNLSTFRGTYASPAGGDWTQDIIKGWHEANARGHGALGDLFAQLSGDIFNVSGVKMGDSPTVFRFLSGDQNDPTKESWGGEFVQRPSGGPGRYYTDNPDDALDFDRPDTDGAMTVYEDRSAWLADFATRLDWLKGDAPAPTPPAPVAGNLLRDASFEGPSVATGQWAELGSTAGWTAIAGGRMEVWDAHGGVTATNGSQFVELDFHSARDGFFQDVDAATGEAYTLSFDLRARPGAPVSSQGVEVVWNDRVVATATPGTDWGTFTTTVTGAAGTDRLIIREVASQGGDGLGALLDDFVLVRSGVPTGGKAPDMGEAPAPTPPPPAAGNLLRDASFEGPSVATGQWAELGSTAGWTAIAGGRMEVWDAHRGVTATNGSQFVELDVQGARDGFFQDVDAATGQAHTLSFDLRARPGAPVSSQGVEVVWNDRVVATATPGTDWGKFTTTVTGAAGTDRLIIREVASQGGDGLGALLDDFVLVRSGAPAGGTAPDTVSVRVSGDAWEGDPAFALLVNGVTVAPSTIVTADRAAGEWQTLTFTGDWDLDGSDQVGVRFLEDRYAGPGRDRNLYVDEVRLNGEVNGADRTFFQAGTETWDF